MASASTNIALASILGWRPATSANTRLHRPWPCSSTLALSVMHTRFLPFASATANAASQMRSTPFRVLISTSCAISSGVPFLKVPPVPVYRPSVFSRTTTKSSSRRPLPLSGLSRSSSSWQGRRLMYRSSSKRIASRMPLACSFPGTRGSPTAPKYTAASSRRSVSMNPSGSTVPSSRYRSAPKSNQSNCSPSPRSSAMRESSRTPTLATSGPIPSPGMTAMRWGIEAGNLASLTRCGPSRGGTRRVRGDLDPCAQPVEHLLRALVGREHGIENVLHLTAEEHQREALQERHARDLEGGQLERALESQPGVAEHLERQAQPPGHLALVLRRLRRQPVHGGAEPREFHVHVPEPAALWRAAPRSRDRVPPRRQVLVRLSRARIGVHDDAVLLRFLREHHLAPARRGQRDRRDHRVRQMPRRTIILRDGQILRQRVEIVGAHSGGQLLEHGGAVVLDRRDDAALAGEGPDDAGWLLGLELLPGDADAAAREVDLHLRAVLRHLVDRIVPHHQERQRLVDQVALVDERVALRHDGLDAGALERQHGLLARAARAPSLAGDDHGRTLARAGRTP